MMYKKRSLVTATLVLTLGLAGCSSQPDAPEIKITAPEQMYKDAQEASDLGNLGKAIQILEAIESRFPFGPQADQVQLDLIYAYYRRANIDQALASIDRFLRLNPTHPDVDYVFYMRGLANMQSDENMFHEFFDIDRSDRDPQFSIQAFRDFKQLIEFNPNSHYAPDAKQRMIALRNKISRHNLAVAQYYFERKLYVAAINRSKETLERFGDTASTLPALNIMKESYLALEQDDLAERTQKMIDKNS